MKRKAAKEAKGLSDDQLLEKSMEDDQKRDNMRVALAHRMKMDLLQVCWNTKIHEFYMYPTPNFMNFDIS